MRRACAAILIVLVSVIAWPRAEIANGAARFALSPPLLSLKRGLAPGTFFDVVGRRSAVFGYESGPLEVWVYPLKTIDQLQLSFRLEGYPLPVPAAELRGTIDVRPEATITTWSHAAFTVRQILFAPIDEPAVVMLLDIDSALPMTVLGSFRPALRPMWPATAQTPNVGWNGTAELYELTDDSGRFAAIVGVPGGVDASVMPYQEEPRDVPLQFSIDVTPEQGARAFVPVIVTAAVDGREHARAAYDRVRANIPALYRRTAEHYARLLQESSRINTPDANLDSAFDWARVGMDKGLATNPMLGTGLVAGFRTSGNSERPGFAWFFGRDALWTSMALTASGSLDSAQTALTFLEKYQRADGKIPHEISQSATLVPWFTEFPYAWASADATPLYVIAHGDVWRASGDRDFLTRYWPSILEAYDFSAATDADGNGLIENTGVGHGWVEGGALYPPHEEIYLQGLWIEASRILAEMADAMGDGSRAERARAAAERTRKAVEDTYWLADRGHYAAATMQPRKVAAVAEPGPWRGRRQQRLDELAARSLETPRPLIDEDTVLPAVPMWWRVLDSERADAQVDHLGSGALATDWGQRILSDRSRLYDPLSYHYGSVWPLFTGWASVAAYRYGRPHVGLQALQANVALSTSGALGFVTELLSGDFNAPFGRSSHHQIWSEAMVVAPIVRGMLGVEPLEGGSRLRIAPQLPVNWDRTVARRVLSAGVSFDVDIQRTPGSVIIGVTRDSAASSRATPALVIAPAFPLDAVIGNVTVDGRPMRPRLVRLGDVQFAEVTVSQPSTTTMARFPYRGGSDVYVPSVAPAVGARSEGIRVLRSRADAAALRLLVEGVSGRTYDLFLRTPRRVGAVNGAMLVAGTADPALRVSFEGPEGQYVRREIVVGLR